MALWSRSATITAIYAAVGLFWIFGSDALLVYAVPAGWLPSLQLAKGVLFVLITAGVLYGFLWREARYLHRIRGHERREAHLRGW